MVCQMPQFSKAFPGKQKFCPKLWQKLQQCLPLTGDEQKVIYCLGAQNFGFIN